MNLRATYVPAFAFALFLACSSSSSVPKTDDFTGSCSLLASRCHPIKTALGKECHALGHDGDDAKCGPRRSACLAECPETVDTDASTPADSGGEEPKDAGGDAAPDAASTPCATYCACMVATCASEPNYPFAGEAACLAACAGFTADDRSCYTGHCEDAKTAADKEHDCEHASGAVACH